MPSRHRAASGERLDWLEGRLAADRHLHISTEVHVYARGPDDTPECIEQRPDLDLLVDPRTGARRLRHTQEDTDRWDHAARRAVKIRCPITAHEAQVGPLLDDSSKVIWIIGGSRAGKTDTLALKGLRTWMLRGGDGHDLWWLAPSWSQARIGAKKLYQPTRSRPAVFDGRIVADLPPASLTTDRNTSSLIDGSRFVFHHANGDGDNLRGWDIVGGFVDEFTAIKKVENFRIALNRTLDADAPLVAASTPKRGHWSLGEILRARDSDDAAVYSWTCHANPWMSRRAIDRLIAQMGGPDDPVVRREVYGEWVADAVMAFEDFEPEKHVLDQPPIGVDVTAQAARRLWRRQSEVRYIGGQDFNVNPMTTVLGRVIDTKGSGDPNDWFLWIENEVQTIGRIESHCERLARSHPGIPIACDATGGTAAAGAHSAAVRTSDTTIKIMRAHGFDSKPCRRYKGKPANPRQIDSLNLCNRLLRERRVGIHPRCEALRSGLERLEARPDGRISKVPGAESDRMSSAPDAFRYLVEAIFGSLFRDQLRGDAPRGVVTRADRESRAQ